VSSRSAAYGAARERLERGQTVVLDGGVGSELVRRGVRWRDHGLRTDAAAVQALHAEYVRAGAHVIRTNTFQLNRRVYENVFRDADHRHHIGAPDLDQRIPLLVPKAVDLARAARDEAGRREVAVAGVMSPLEHCFRPDLAASDEQAHAAHAEIARLLAGAGVDLLLLESMNTLGETRVAIAAALEAGLPVWVSFVVDADGHLLSGESLSNASRMLCDSGVDAMLVNCAPPDDIGRALAAMDGADAWRGGYAHIGRFDPPSWKFEFFPQFTGTDEWTPRRYAAAAAEWQTRGARIVGGCCGTGPAHVRALAEVVV
jgi:S-methylmethionine-dependent homocysteine/selenocysteine methylase